MDGIYVKNTSINAAAATKMSREPAQPTQRNNQSIYSENIMKRGDGCNAPLKSDKCNVQIVEAKSSLEHRRQRKYGDGGMGSEEAADDDGYQAIGIPSTCDQAQRICATTAMTTPKKNHHHHQYANDEQLCKFNARNNNAVEKVNGISKWQPQQGIVDTTTTATTNSKEERLFLLSTSPSTSSSMQKLTQQNAPAHPFYYVQQHLASPRQDRRNKSVDGEKQTQEHYEIASKLQYYNERLHSPNINCVSQTARLANNTNISHSNNVAAFKHQQQHQQQIHQNHYNEVNSSSFERVASSASEMTIPEKHQFNKSAGNFATDEHQFPSNNTSDSRQCLQQQQQQQTMQMQMQQPQHRRRTPPPIPSSTPSVPLTGNHKVSD